MSVFHFTLLVNDPPATVLTAALGADADNNFVEADVGKGVKMGTAQNYVPVAKDDDIEGVVSSVSAEATVNDGFSLGGVQVDRRILAEVGVSELGTADVGELVVADTPIAQGTDGILQVYPGSPTNFKWRIIRIVSGTGAAGDTVLLEKV